MLGWFGEKKEEFCVPFGTDQIRDNRRCVDFFAATGSIFLYFFRIYFEMFILEFELEIETSHFEIFYG